MTWHVVRRWKRSRFWAVIRCHGAEETLVCVCVYRKGAEHLAATLSYGGQTYGHAAA